MNKGGGQQVTPEVLTYGDLVIKIERKRVKHLRLRVLPPLGDVLVTLPAGATREMALRFIEEKYNWIQKARERVAKRPENAAQHCFRSERLSLFGEVYELRICHGQRTTVCKEGALSLGVSATASEDACRAALDRYLRRRLDEAVQVRFERFAAEIGVNPSSYYLRRMTTRWGTCNTKSGRICINLNLVHYPMQCLEYVLIHELCHLSEPAHNNRFWELVERYCPEYRKVRRLMNQPKNN